MVGAGHHPDREEPHEADTHSAGLVVGSYCHDVLFRDGAPVAETLGGAASFISAILHPLSPPSSPFHFISKVGADFLYPSSIPHPFLVSVSSPTAVFHAHFTDGGGGGGDRILRRVAACQPILPSDLPEGSGSRNYRFGLAVGVAGEIVPETLDRLLNICQIVLVDVQGLIRSFDPVDGTVSLVSLGSTDFAAFLPRISFLKASSKEAPFVDVAAARRRCCVIVKKKKKTKKKRRRRRRRRRRRKKTLTGSPVSKKILGGVHVACHVKKNVHVCVPRGFPSILTGKLTAGRKLKASRTCRGVRTLNSKIGWSLQNPPTCGVVWALYPNMYI